MIEGRTLTSIILHGPPGTGKTSLASVIANTTESHFVKENAANVSVKRIREIIEEAIERLTTTRKRTILFLDEIHRFSKSQQDVLLEDVERGRIILIGATTENPMFAVNSALVSRSTVFRLEPLNERDIERLVRRAITDVELGYGKLQLHVTEDAVRHWATISDGDARRALTALEVAVKSAGGDAAMYSANPVPIDIDLKAAEQSIQHKAIVYSGDGDQHYDTISAFIKSIRGSDPDAAIYWLALMIEAGEDPRFIARRLAILASEDIGNADPRAIIVADATWSLVERIGMPEARITLAQCVTYLALAPKSNASYMAINAAMEDVKEGRTRPVPIELRDPNKVKCVGSDVEGKGYEYSHDSATRTSIGGVTRQSHMGVDKRYYEPAGIGAEEILKRRLEEVRNARESQRRGS
jgi:putative ATPase